MPDAAMIYAIFDTPIGPMLIAGRDDVVHRLAFDGGRTLQKSGWQRDDTAFAEARSQLADWFTGARTMLDFPTTPWPDGFLGAVMTEMAAIPFARTCSYGDIAKTLGGDARAVGKACGDNPLPLIVPCHRVIGADGSLTGFGGGLPAKRWLLAHEARIAPQPGSQADLFA